MNIEEKETKITKLLGDLTPGFYPEPMFLQFSRLTVNPIVEIVPLRKRAGKVEVLLLERDANDIVFRGKLHTPGTVVRPHDTPGSFNDAFNRIFNAELAGVKVGKPEFVQNIFHNSGRGMEASQIYWVELLDEPQAGQFYAADALPERLMESQLDFIPHAIKHYLKFQKK